MKLRKRVLTLVVAVLSIGLIGCSKEESATSSQLEDTNLELAESNDNETEKDYTSYESYDNSEDEQSTDEQSSLSSNNDTNTSSSSNNSSNYDKGDNEHIGEYVYITNGNSYYHTISNCKYLEGASTSYVKLTSDMRKFECNCWENPVEYNPPSSSSNEGSSNETSSSSGKTVYIAKGNSYYHNSASCKFLNGASAYGVDLNDVGGKHACNCVKY
ncbi:hypothetical protein LPC27_01625 [Paraclostridium bifermentans]|uniref:hypothetical protein n=1 Tax=Paraclostridium TaxID=1849822 RepID=UPI00038CE5DF|nr:hypothetical protein [Paraclostridium bifermentans]EQK47401.1 putative lipoprotein [[Clostridium] bifermentans ATCC 19299] [Paraclostridium bifermentans ATCC 19299]MCE9674451.1 hypothetical protein [Paraclostridium bifermentans]